MKLKRYPGGTKVPPGIYLESWSHHPICVKKNDPALPGPPERRFRQIPPLLALFLAPVSGTFFMLGFLILTPLILLAIPFLAIGRLFWYKGAGKFKLLIVTVMILCGPIWVYAQVGSNQYCLNCHRNPLSKNLPDGTKVSLQIHSEKYIKSVHGRKLLCTACHTDIQTFPHPRRSYKDRRDLVMAYSKACTTCHVGKFKEFQEGVHWALLQAKDRRAPLCADCHGAHTISNDGLNGNNVPHACANCHPKVFSDYKKSVHGGALLNKRNTSVPSCATCHRSHTIEDPRKVEFRLNIPKLCADCHADEELMELYGISTHVVSTYLNDFHGVSVALYGAQNGAPARLTAVCTDCHGIHDIRSVKDPESHVVKKNLLKTCKKCHPGATINFPGAWLSHYPPSPDRAPLVYYVKLFYFLFIPGVVGGLVIHLGLDLFHDIRTRWAARKGKDVDGQDEE